MEENFNNIGDEIGNIGYVEGNDEPKFIVPDSLKYEKASENLASIVDNQGWINIDLGLLPSKGDHYPYGTAIRIRAASSGEIRHWSTIDETDFMSITDGVNKILDKCAKISFIDKTASYKDIKEIDRFYLIFAIKEITFKKGENTIKNKFACSCGHTEEKELFKEMFSFFKTENLPENLRKYYDANEKCFKIKLKNGEEFDLYLPSVGISKLILSYAKDLYSKKQDPDEAFIKWAPYLIKDWRSVYGNDAKLKQFLHDTFLYSHSKISVINYFIGAIAEVVDPKITSTCSSCGSEVSIPFDIPGGIKAIFLVSDISSELL